MIENLGALYDRHGEKVRFLVVGVWNTVFGLAVLWMLDTLIAYDARSLLQKELVLIAAWVISVTQNFVTFKFLVFRSKGRWLREYVRTYMTYAATFLLQSAMTLTISQVFRLTVFWANVPTTVVIMALTYVGHKYFTFRQPAADDVIDEGDA